MRTNQCFYCGNENENDERTIGNIGIRYCTEHKASAKRDSNAYLHEHGMVKTRDALQHPVLGPFLSLMASPVYIRRSNGDVEGQWSLQNEPWHDEKLILSKNSTWYIPMIHTKTETTKGVSLEIFEDERVASLNNPAIRAQLPSIRALLEEGLYKTDYEAYQLVSPSRLVPETKGVEYCYSNGQLGRIFIPLVERETV